MNNILTALDKYQTLSDEAKELFIPHLEQIELEKGSVLIAELQVSPFIFFIEKGAVKNHFIDEKGNKNVVWFGFEGDMSFSLSAYFDIPYYHEQHELIEDCLLYRMKIKQFKQLYFKNHEWANWGRCLAETHLVKIFKEIDEHRPLNAKERYLHLINSNPNIQNRVPLKDIASYLGVSPVSISRFRSSKEVK